MGNHNLVDSLMCVHAKNVKPDEDDSLHISDRTVYCKL